ncbi:hypothetical protein [Pseudomonas chlororaphis]|uniref:hypothetical protein n=1 Tax=Pseudomonas chlororaphis TaxID=587753 RepID=UPI0006A633C0|nr:hypothetical protein [Pseudomonas chlororaphis]
MTTARHLLTTLRAFHLDNPQATWEQLKERLKDIAEGVLQTRAVWDGFGGLGHVYSDVGEDLAEIASAEPLSFDQAKAVELGRRIMLAAEQRTEGDPSGIIAILEELRQEPVAPANWLTTGQQPALPLTGDEPMTFERLSALHMAEKQDDWQPNTLKNKRACFGVLSGLLGALDLRHHTRKDMTDLKTRLMEGRKVPVGHGMFFNGKANRHYGMPVTEGERNLLVHWSEVK